ncbi:MAG: mismatch repair protein MutL [Chloroflexi bacterium]|nr:mismatch repair protein MutL [Chloroflexota bacterium]
MTALAVHRPQARIRTLDPQLAARIAAGEVIERPSSVVKELLENALDAGSTSIRVELEGGGLDRIRLIDNGCGIAVKELELAFQRHATSKLSTLEDLDSITTLGFRGEALPSIAAVSSVRIRSRQMDDVAGASLHLREGVVVDRRTEGLPAGTTIEVTELFENLPARRKFLKGRQAEAGAAQQVVMQYAIVNPGVAMTLVVDGQIMFSTSGAETLRDVLACLYGLELVEHLVELDGDRHGIRVQGLTSRIGHTKATRTQQSFFVNGRWVRNRVLNVALEEGYHSMLMGGRHPIGIVLLDVPPDELDVNVHPAKTEIRFLRERDLFGAIRHAVQAAISPGQSIVQAVETELQPEAIDALQLPLIDHLPSEASEPEPILAPQRALPALRVLGQASALFIIAEGPEGVYMVDQHAAHERVLYDDLAAQIANRNVAVQILLEPLLIDVSPSSMEALLAYGDLIRALGFEAEPFGDATCMVRAVPTMLGGTSASETLQALLEDLAAGKEQAERQDRVLATMACKAAVKAGQTLSMEEMRFLVQRLENTNRPQTCPHGRPTMILLSTSALERQFGRR